MNVDAHPETLILNGAECEPWISCDDMLMRERADEIIQGAQIMSHALQCKQVMIGIEDNKPEACDALQAAATGTAIQVVVVPTRYPAGGEKQLIKVLTGKEVPSQGLPVHIGIVCHNVATAAAIYHAITKGEPLIDRIVTITGAGIPTPVNVEALIGTPAAELVRQAGANPDQLESLTMGGPMMGFALPDHAVPIIKTTNCLLAEQHKMRKPAAMPCIRCGECADVCPASLLPQQLYWYARAHDFDKVQDYHLFDCIECGCCDYVCPSHIPLVQYYRFAKTAIWQQERDKQKADHARERHEFHLERIEREKREREERRKQKHAELKKSTDKDKDDPKKAAILAALARVKEKKTQRQVQPKNTDNLTDEQKKQIAEVEARRKKHLE
jgi:electron transport complex protein RnfC